MKLIKFVNINIFFLIFYVIINILACCHFIGLSQGALALSVLVVGLIFFLPYEYLGVFLYACLPFYNILNPEMGTTSLFYFLIIISLFLYLFNEKETNKATRILIYLGIICLTAYNIVAPESYIKWLLRILPLVFFLNASFMRKQIMLIMQLFVTSMVIASIWGWIYLKAGLSIYTRSYVYNSGEVTTRFAGLVGDSVFFGVQATLCIAILGLLWYYGKKSLTLYGATFVLLTFFIMQSYAKTSLLCVILIVIYWYWVWLISAKRDMFFYIKNLTLWASIIAVVYVVINLFMNSNFIWISNIRARLESTDMYTGRQEIWGYFWHQVTTSYSSIYRGIGMDNYPLFAEIATDQRMLYIGHAHNVYLETVVLFGFIATFVILVLLIITLIKAYKKSNSLINFSLCVLLILVGQSVHGHFEFFYYLDWLLALSIAMIDKDTAQEIKLTNLENE